MTQVQVESGYPGTGGSGSKMCEPSSSFSKVAPSNEGTVTLHVTDPLDSWWMLLAHYLRHFPKATMPFIANFITIQPPNKIRVSLAKHIPRFPKKTKKTSSPKKGEFSVPRTGKKCLYRFVDQSYRPGQCTTIIKPQWTCARWRIIQLKLPCGGQATDHIHHY